MLTPRTQAQAKHTVPSNTVTDLHESKARLSLELLGSPLLIPALCSAAVFSLPLAVGDAVGELFWQT